MRWRRPTVALVGLTHGDHRPRRAGWGPQPGASAARVGRRVHGVIDEQDRMRALLDAVVTTASDLTPDGVLRRVLTAARALTGARYAALGSSSVVCLACRAVRTLSHVPSVRNLRWRFPDRPPGAELQGQIAPSMSRR